MTLYRIAFAIERFSVTKLKVSYFDWAVLVKVRSSMDVARGTRGDAERLGDCTKINQKKKINEMKRTIKLNDTIETTK